MKNSLFRYLCLAVALVSCNLAGAQQKANYQLAEKFRLLEQNPIDKYSTEVRPTFINDTDCFYYSFTTREGKKYYYVNPKKKEKRLLFDTDELLSKIAVYTKKAYSSADLHLSFTFMKDNETIRIDFDRRLYVVRRVFEQSSDDTYVASLSSRTIVYKGMFLVKQLRMFFEDLQNPDYESAIAVVHSRFSTNTNPSWERAHPNRFIVHNGEINTIRGNADKMRAREENMESEHLEGELYKVLPAINTAGSDSAMLDNTLEFMVMSGIFRWLS